MKLRVYFGLLLICLCLCACESLKRSILTSPPEGLVQESYTMRLTSYKQSLVVNASPQEIQDFLLDTSNLQMGGIDAEIMADDTGGRLTPGLSIPFHISWMGQKFRGNIIALDQDNGSLWLIWDNPRALHIDRFKFEPLEQGTRLTVQGNTEVPDTWIYNQGLKLVRATGSSDKILRNIDLFMAEMQAHFNPSLEPQDLVQSSIRGQHFETLLQVHQARFWINASPQDVENCASRTENNSLHFKDRDNQDCLILCDRQKRSVSFRSYAVVHGLFGGMELEIKPHKDGSLACLRSINEIPGSDSGQDLESILFLNGMPDLLKQKANLIKRESEEAI